MLDMRMALTCARTAGRVSQRGSTTTKNPEWRHCSDTMFAIAGGTHDLHPFPQSLGEELLVDGEVRELPCAAAQQCIESIGEVDHDLAMHGILQAIGDLGRTTARQID